MNINDSLILPNKVQAWRHVMWSPDRLTSPESSWWNPTAHSLDGFICLFTIDHRLLQINLKHGRFSVLSSSQSHAIARGRGQPKLEVPISHGHLPHLCRPRARHVQAHAAVPDSRGSPTRPGRWREVKHSGSAIQAPSGRNRLQRSLGG